MKSQRKENKGFKVQKLIDRNANCDDKISTGCINVFKYHIIAYKYGQVLHINQKCIKPSGM